MIDAQMLSNEYNRQKEFMEALEARWGKWEAAMIRSTATSMILSRMSIPPEGLIDEAARKISSKYAQEAATWAVLSLEIALRGRDRADPKPGKMSKEDEEFLEKLTEELSTTMDQLRSSLDVVISSRR